MFWIFLFIQIITTCPGEKYCRQCLEIPNMINECIQCEDSYFDIISKSCIQINNKISNCKIYQKNENISCQICNYGYTLQNNICVPCHNTFCAYCENDINVCQGCFGQRKLKDGHCVSNQVCKIENCEICSEIENQCKKCHFSYSLDKGQCISGPSNCFEVKKNDIKKCEICDFGYYITNDYLCQENYKMDTLKAVLILLICSLIIITGIVLYKYCLGNDKKDTDSYFSVE